MVIPDGANRSFKEVFGGSDRVRAYIAIEMDFVETANLARQRCCTFFPEPGPNCRGNQNVRRVFVGFWVERPRAKTPVWSFDD